MITEVTSGIFSADHSVAEGKNAIVIGTRGAVAIDTGLLPEEGQAMYDFIRDRGLEPNRVILTHGHSDHIFGGLAFAGAEVYASATTPDEIHRQTREFAERKGLKYEDMLEQALWPTITFTDELHIDLGDKHLWLFPTPGHSPDHISVYVEEDLALIAGDTVVTGIVPAIFHDSKVLEDSISKLTKLDIEVLVAGHGPVLTGTAQIQDWLAWLMVYISSVRAFVHEKIESDSAVDPETLADEVEYQRFVGDRLPVDKFGMPTRHRNMVLKIIEEEMEARG